VGQGSERTRTQAPARPAFVPQVGVVVTVIPELIQSTYSNTSSTLESLNDYLAAQPVEQEAFASVLGEEGAQDERLMRKVGKW